MAKSKPKNYPKGLTVGSTHVQDGAVTHAGAPMGRLDSALKHGYHPAYKLTLQAAGWADEVTWYEMDEHPSIGALLADVDRRCARFAKLTSKVA
jgi:hypothetical protein